jgi:hypothetical protein
LFQLLRGDRVCEERDNVRLAGFIGREHLKRIAYEVKLATSHTMRVEDVRVRIGAVGEEEPRAIVLQSPAAVADDLPLSVVELSRNLGDDD